MPYLLPSVAKTGVVNTEYMTTAINTRPTTGLKEFNGTYAQASPKTYKQSIGHIF